MIHKHIQITERINHHRWSHLVTQYHQNATITEIRNRLSSTIDRVLCDLMAMPLSENKPVSAVKPSTLPPSISSKVILFSLLFISGASMASDYGADAVNSATFNTFTAISDSWLEYGAHFFGLLALAVIGGWFLSLIIASRGSDSERIRDEHEPPSVDELGEREARGGARSTRKQWSDIMKRKTVESNLAQAGLRMLYQIGGIIVLLIAVYGLLILSEAAATLPVSVKWGAVIVVALLFWFGINYFKVRVENGDFTTKPWNENTGNKPDCAKVNAQYKSGNIEWNTDPEELDWSLDLSDPIAEWIAKR